MRSSSLSSHDWKLTELDWERIIGELRRAVAAIALGSDPAVILEDVAAALVSGDQPLEANAEAAVGGGMSGASGTRISDASASSDGDLGWLSSGQMEPAVQQAVEQMEEGSHSNTPVKSDFGWHVLLLEQRRQVPQPSFEEVKADLLQKKQQALLAGYIQELRSKANLVVDAQQSPPEAGTDTAEEKSKAEE